MINLSRKFFRLHNFPRIAALSLLRFPIMDNKTTNSEILEDSSDIIIECDLRSGIICLTLIVF